MNDQLAHEILAELKAISEHLQTLVRLQTPNSPETVFSQNAMRGVPSRYVFAHANPPNQHVNPDQVNVEVMKRVRGESNTTD